MDCPGGPHPCRGWLGPRLGTKRLFLLSTSSLSPARCSAGLAWDQFPDCLPHPPGDRGRPDHPTGHEHPLPHLPPGETRPRPGPVQFQSFVRSGHCAGARGHLIEVFNWRAIIYINVPFGLLSAAIVFLSMPTTQDQPPRPFDAVGVLSMASFLVLLLLAVSEGRRYGWGAPMIVTLFVHGGVSLVIFLITELKLTNALCRSPPAIPTSPSRWAA